MAGGRKGRALGAGVQAPDEEKRLLLHAVKNGQLIQSGLDALFYLPVRIHAHYVRDGEASPLVLRTSHLTLIFVTFKPQFRVSRLVKTVTSCSAARPSVLPINPVNSGEEVSPIGRGADKGGL